MSHDERGTIILTDARRHSYKVHLASGRTMNMNRMMTHPGDFLLLPHGTAVAVSFAYGAPYIVGVLPPETAPAEEENPLSVTDTAGHGGEDPAIDINLGVSARASGQPRDTIPGDHVMTSPDGAMVAALMGRVAQISSGPLAKVQTFGATNAVQILSGLFRLVTWMGESSYSNVDGKTSFTWKGGTDQLTQTGADEQRYTIRLDVGHVGDMVKLEVTTPEGQPLFRFHVNPEGRCELFAAGGFDQHSGSQTSHRHPVRYQGAREEEVAGTHSSSVTGAVSVEHGASRTESVSENLTMSIGRDDTRNVTGDARFNVGGLYQAIVAGNHSTDVTDGDVSMNVGLAHFHRVKTTTGDTLFETTSGKFKISYTAPDSIELGSSANYHASRYEALATLVEAIQSDLNNFKSTYNAHTHVLTGNAGPFPVTGTASPTPSAASPSNFDHSPVKSLIVKIA